MTKGLVSKKTQKRLLAAMLCGLLVFGMTGCGLLDDEYDDYYDDYGYDEYDEYEDDYEKEDAQEKDTKEEKEPVTSNVTGNSAETVSTFFPDGVVRDKQVQLKGDGTDTVTVLIYMNGSNLESDGQEATKDLSEIVAAGYSENVNILVETLGTKKWDKKFGISSERTQIYKVNERGLTLMKDDLGQLDCTEEESLRDFIIWGVQNYPADRYILHFWNHGGGPVYGFGYDEWVKEEDATLTIDEMQNALKAAGVYFDFVGMDCCLMSCLEVCCAFYDYCDYMILSEDFESGLGWDYTNWIKTLYKNPSASTVELGKMICDDMVAANEKDTIEGDRSIMALIDQSMLKILYTAWTDFAYENESALLGKNYSRSVKRGIGGRVLPAIAKNSRPNGWNWDFFGFGDADEVDETSMAEYFVTDIMEVAGSVDSDKSAALSAAIDATLVYVKSTESDAGLTGIAVSLPYGDSDYYKNMKKIFSGIGLDNNYVDWVGKFVEVSGATSESDHDSWDDFWEGWDEYDEDYDWEEWDYAEDSYGGSFWDSFGFGSWDYEDSWNEWYDEEEWDDDCQYQGDDWFYGDDYWYEDDWYGDGDDDEDADWWWF